MLNKKNLKLKNIMATGFSLTEIIVYAAIFSMLALVLTSFLIGTLRAWTNAKAQQDVIFGAQHALNYVAQIVKPAKNINLTDSILDTDLGRLTVTTEQNLPAHNRRFFVQNNTLYEEDVEGLITLALTSDNISISQFRISTITSSTTPQGVQISLSATSKSIPLFSKTFYATLVWRGGY